MKYFDAKLLVTSGALQARKSFDAAFGQNASNKFGFRIGIINVLPKNGSTVDDYCTIVAIPTEDGKLRLQGLKDHRDDTEAGLCEHPEVYRMIDGQWSKEKVFGKQVKATSDNSFARWLVPA